MRWAQQTIEAEETTRLPGISGDAVVRHFDAPEALHTRFYEVRAKSALNKIPGGARLPFSWTVNPYRGCSHSCFFCFARPTHTFLDFNAAEDFEREIVVKVNAPEVLRTELARPSWKGEHVALGTNTDPYQWVEKQYELMRGIWEALRDAANPCSVLTRSPLILRDLDLMLEIRARTHFTACLSIPTLDEKTWRETEPRSPHPRKRLEALAELNRAGIPTGILIAPLMPGINDSPEQVNRIVELADEAGAVSIGGQALFLRGETKDVFMGWLRHKRPDLVARYEKLYAGRAYLRGAEKAEIEKVLPRRRRRREEPEPRFVRGEKTAAEVATGQVRPRPGGGAPAAESLAPVEPVQFALF